MRSFRKKIFTLRGYTPIPFLIAMIAFARPNTITMLAGLIMAAAGELMRFWGVAYAGSLTRVTGSVGAPEIIMNGPFKYVRNPLYIGNLLTYIGIGIMSNAVFPWLTLAAFVWFVFQYYQIVMLEEEFLEKEFSSTYIDYKQNVPRFIPRVSPYLNPVQEKQFPNWKNAVSSEQRTFQALSLVWFTLIVLWYLR